MKSVPTQYRVQKPLKILLLCMTEMNGPYTDEQNAETLKQYISKNRPYQDMIQTALMLFPWT
jgi:hypothetical protein